MTTPPLGGEDHTEPDIVVEVDGSEPEPVGAASEPGIEVPGAAADHPSFPAAGATGVANGSRGIIPVPVLAPFPDIAVQVIQAPGIGTLLADRMDLAA